MDVTCKLNLHFLFTSILMDWGCLRCKLWRNSGVCLLSRKLGRAGSILFLPPFTLSCLLIVRCSQLPSSSLYFPTHWLLNPINWLLGLWTTAEETLFKRILLDSWDLFCHYYWLLGYLPCNSVALSLFTWKKGQLTILLAVSQFVEMQMGMTDVECFEQFGFSDPTEQGLETYSEVQCP